MGVKIYSSLYRVGNTENVGYATRKVTYSKIDWYELVQHVSQDTGVFEGIVEAAMHSLTKQIREMVLNGHSVKVQHLGSFRFSISAKMQEKMEDCTARKVRCRRLIFTPDPYLKGIAEGTPLIKLNREDADSLDEDGELADE